MSTNYEHLLQDLERAESRIQPKVNADQKLSLCMIVKNEEAYLADCLASVQDVVDEMVIVDTGSTDRTVEIARQYGARVFFKEWDDDFAAARNESLRRATGSWVLVLDADERLPQQFKTQLRSLLIPTEQPLSYLLYIKNYMLDQDESSVIGHYMARLFRKTPVTQFVGVIHEQLYPNWGGVTIPEDSCYLVHLGYGKVKKKLDKIENRNKPLIEKALAEHKDVNPDLYSFYAYYMGMSFIEATEVKKWTLESIRSSLTPREHSHIPIAYVECLNACYALKEYEEGIEIAQSALTRVPELAYYPDFLDYYGLLLAAAGQYSQAIGVLQDALKYGDKKQEETLFFITRSHRVGSWETMLRLGFVYALNGMQAEAEELLRQALSHYPDPDKTPLINKIDKVMGSANLTAAYLKDLTQNKTENRVYDIKALSNAYLKLEKPLESILLQAQLHDPDAVLIAAVKLADMYLTHQRPDLARQVYEAMLKISPSALLAELGLRQLQLHDEALSPDMQEISHWRQKCTDSDDLMALGDFCQRFALWDQAESIYSDALAEGAEQYKVTLHLAAVAQHKEDFQKAQHLLLGLLEQYPERTAAYVQLGNLQLALGGFTQAEVQFAHVKALESEVPDWYAFYGMGIALAGQERFAEAEAELKEACRLAPGQSAPVYMLEMITRAQAEGNALEAATSLEPAASEFSS